MAIALAIRSNVVTLPRRRENAGWLQHSFPTRPFRPRLPARDNTGQSTPFCPITRLRASIDR